MLSKIQSIRVQTIQSHLTAAMISTVTFIIILFTLSYFFHIELVTKSFIFIISLLAFATSSFIAIYQGYKSGGTTKKRLDEISTIIASLSRGKYHSQLMMDGSDEIAQLSADLNQLSHNLKNQVISMQRLVDEKTDFAKTAEKAAAIEERQRLARDLHDAISQQLFALSMMSQATVRIFEKKPELAKQQMEEIAKMAQQAQTEMRALLLHLRPVHLSGQSLKEGLPALIEELKGKSQILFDLSIKDSELLSEGIEEHLFRVIQEALSNILRHADATTVKLKMWADGKNYYTYVQDNGKGFSTALKKENKTSYGLKTMKERIEEIGGTLVIRSKEQEGTYIEIRVPIQGERGKENE
ncbi:sensor histidine kinase [Bacillaceae bacterium S4-13-58]